MPADPEFDPAAFRPTLAAETEGFTVPWIVTDASAPEGLLGELEQASQPRPKAKAAQSERRRIFMTASGGPRKNG
jgi:hypothetical protein